MSQAQNKPDPKKWAFMNNTEKTMFVTKVVIMVCSFGFVFGNVLTD